MNLQQHATGGNRECSSDERQSGSSSTTTTRSTHNNGQGSPSSLPSSVPQGAIIVAAGTASSSTEQQQQQQQQQHHQLHAQPREVVHHPNELDILSGRGSGIINHPGNRLYRRLVDANKPLYRACPRRLKPLLAQSIVDAMAMQHSSRFLKVIDGDAAANDTAATTPRRWYDIGRAAAIAKTCQALREGGSSSSSTTATTTTSTSHDEVSHIICETHVPTCCDIVHTTTAIAANAAAVVVLSDSDDDEEEDSGSDGDVSSGRSNSPRSCRLLSSTVLDNTDETLNSLNYDSDDE